MKDRDRLVTIAIRTAVGLLETQDGRLYPIAHAIDAHERVAFVGTYNGVVPDPLSALERLRAQLRAARFRSTAVIYGTTMPDDPHRSALCIEFESLDAAAEAIFVPFVVTRPWMRSARVITYAPRHYPGHRYDVCRAGS